MGDSEFFKELEEIQRDDNRFSNVIDLRTLAELEPKPSHSREYSGRELSPVTTTSGLSDAQVR